MQEPSLFKVKRYVSKAFLITGGNKESRLAKCEEMIEDDVCNMFMAYRRDNAIALIFSYNHSDFDNMTFDEAARIAGDNELGANFRTSSFGNEEKFGKIELQSQSSSLQM